MRFRAAAFAFLLPLLTGTAQATYRNAVWIPTWGSSLASIQTNIGAFQESNPVWYALNSDGSIALKNGAEDPTALAAMVGTDIIPTIQNTVNGNFNAAVATQVIGTAAARNAHADAILQLVVSKAYDGIDVDYESLPATQMSNFSAFVQTLAQKLHNAGKKLSVAVYPKTSASDNWNGPGAEDYSAIGASADYVKVMAYDYHWDTSAPGPISPLTWLDTVATYATSTIPASKVMMALPWYGYDWQGSTGVGVTYPDAIARAQANGATIAYDANGEATFTYAGHTVFFQDAASYGTKVAMLKANHPSIAGFAHWAAGQEDPQIWQVMRGILVPGSSNPATPPAADFAVSGPSALTLNQGGQTSATYRLTPINGFSGTAKVQISGPAFAGSVVASSQTVNATAPVTVRVSASRTARPGTYQFTVRFSNGSTTREELVNVIVQGVGRIRAARH